MHLVCHSCGAIQEIEDLSVGEPLRQTLHDRYGFQSDLTHLAIAGRCRNCASAAAAAPSAHQHAAPETAS